MQAPASRRRSARRRRVTVTLPADLLERIDREAAGSSRSSVVERWLREAARSRVQSRIEEATIAYYEGLTTAEEREDEALARALASGARRLDVDGK